MKNRKKLAAVLLVSALCLTPLRVKNLTSGYEVGDRVRMDSSIPVIL